MLILPTFPRGKQCLFPFQTIAASVVILSTRRTPSIQYTSCLHSQYAEKVTSRYPSHNHLLSVLRFPQGLRESRKVHGLLLVTGLLHLDSSIDLGSELINAYVSLGSLQDAFLLFRQRPSKNVLSWNSFLRNFVIVGGYKEALQCFQLMLRDGPVPDNFTYPLVLKSCSGLSELERGREIKNLIYSNERYYGRKANIFVECALIDMFCKCGSLNEARESFDRMSQRDLVSWTAMICGIVQHGNWIEALDLFRKMRLEGFTPDSVIVAAVLPASGRLGALKQGMGLHGFSFINGYMSDLCVANALVDMYCRCGMINHACALFYSMEVKDVISWSSLIAGHLLNEEFNEGLELFAKMIESDARPGPVTIATILPGFSHLKLFRKGKQIHGYTIRHGYELDGFVASALLDMYAKSGALRAAEFIFDSASEKDIAVWNSMLMGYAINDDAGSVFKILQRIHKSKFKPNSITVITVLPVCTQLGTMKQGREIHGYTTRNGLSSVVSVQNSIIDMYCKSGSLEHGMKAFEQMVEKDVVTYNTIIAAVGMHGHFTRASSLFTRMKEEKIRPNKLTFVSLLSACSHAGQTALGWFFYNSMSGEYGILPEMEHYSCMVDLLGRSGCLDEAWEFIQKMPVAPDIDVLGSLLGACRIHKKIEIAELVANRIFDMQPTDPGYYVLLSNIYAAARRWADVLKVRNMVKEKGLAKKPGNSSIQVGCGIHLFNARDRSHKQIDEIHKNLKNLLLQMKDEGYVPDFSFFLHDSREDEDDLFR
ncbi:putative pentatricopeptide repeat-containing protein At3g01580 [Aristolochia californica]|uniref:putative pentatricopeptide repeat-containing protein At3g01580 n=1 Tax=Aristolochia californica TaxID=171875 RepID=UPI0035E13F98